MIQYIIITKIITTKSGFFTEVFCALKQDDYYFRIFDLEAYLLTESSVSKIAEPFKDSDSFIIINRENLKVKVAR